LARLIVCLGDLPANRMNQTYQLRSRRAYRAQTLESVSFALQAGESPRIRSEMRMICTAN
jgi:hypothetical protein